MKMFLFFYADVMPRCRIVEGRGGRELETYTNLDKHGGRTVGDMLATPARRWAVSLSCLLNHCFPTLHYSFEIPVFQAEWGGGGCVVPGSWQRGTLVLGFSQRFAPQPSQ